MLLSPSIPSAIIPALPFVFLTQELDVFSATTLEQCQLPADLQVTKRFLSSDVDALKQEFLEVKDMGQGTVSEWLKGLAGRGNDMQHDASKWEKWESSGGTAKMCSHLYPGYARKSPASTAQKLWTDALPAVFPNPPPPGPSRPSFAQGRYERTAEEVADLKAARKAEIERRALHLEPPLSADVLRHIPSFQAATHIVAPLDDHAWGLLKPRLLAQRADAEKIREGERITEGRLEQDRLEQRHLETTLATTKEARDRIDKDWEEVQAPLRAKIASYADDVIRDNWGKGKKVTRENCSRFAIDVLLYVRKHFYAEVEKDATTARAAGKAPAVDPRDGPFTQKLTLENMKWIFDTKIKVHTESCRKELFYCSGCEGNFKPFGFEGVIQHYAAKHTIALSLGNIVVHWRAEWPEHPPFSSEARPAKPSSFYPHGANGFPTNGGPPPQTNFAYQPPAQPALPPAYPPSVSYGYGAPTYNDYYQPQAPPLPPQSYQPFTPQPGYEPLPSYAAPPGLYPPYQAPAVPYHTSAVEPTQGYTPPQGSQYDYHHGPYQTSAPTQPPTYPDLYQTKLEDVARNSREVWRLLGDIKDLPGSVRVFVTIHHLVKRFRSRFYETPPLSMFIDGLSNNKDMRPVRNINGLVCKACHLGLGNATSVEQDKKYFSLPQLANHFQTKHIAPTQGMQMPNMAAPIDWVIDMVLLPDISTFSSIYFSVNEAQKSLLAAALPSIHNPQHIANTRPFYQEQQGRQHKSVPPARYAPISANTRDASQTSNSHAGGSGPIDKYSTATESVGAGFLADYRNSGQSSNSATPMTMSENDRSAHSEGGQQSLQGSRPTRGQKRLQNHKTAGKNKRGKAQGGVGSGDRTFGKRFKADDKRVQLERGDAGMRAMRATNQEETPPVQPYFVEPERPGTGGVARSQAPTQPAVQLENHPPRKNHPVFPVGRNEQHSLLGALESHLDRRRSPQFQGQQQVLSAALYTDRHVSSVAPDYQYAPTTYTQSRHNERGDRPGSPVRGPRYEPSMPVVRDRSPSGRPPLGTSYYSAAGSGERREEGYGIQRAQAGLVEPFSRHSEEGRFSRPALRPEDRGHEAAPSEAEQHRYHEGVRIHSRPPVEAYEIVHVIDERGEYYIRRPVRREPEPVYLYEERVAHRDSGPYAAPEPTYGAVPRQSVVREPVRASMAPESWPADRRADPAYYEEYDPRFPAA